MAVETTRRDEAVGVTQGRGVGGDLERNWGFRRGAILTIWEWVEEGGDLKWEGRTARWGWCWSLAEAALIRSHVRRTCLLCKGGVLGARSEADGKDSPLRAEPMLGLDCKWRTKRRKRPSDGIHESEIRLGSGNDQ